MVHPLRPVSAHVTGADGVRGMSLTCTRNRCHARGVAAVVPHDHLSLCCVLKPRGQGARCAVGVQIFEISTIILLELGDDRWIFDEYLVVSTLEFLLHGHGDAFALGQGCRSGLEIVHRFLDVYDGRFEVFERLTGRTTRLRTGGTGRVGRTTWRTGQAGRREGCTALAFG